jgi:hypothetical protein
MSSVTAGGQEGWGVRPKGSRFKQRMLFEKDLRLGHLVCVWVQSPETAPGEGRAEALREAWEGVQGGAEWMTRTE